MKKTKKEYSPPMFLEEEYVIEKGFAASGSLEDPVVVPEKGWE